MPKPNGQGWHEYLRGYGSLTWKAPDHERRYHEINGMLQPIYALQCGNLLDRTGPKVVIATPTPEPVRRQGHPPFTFKAQCLVTGRMSRPIPYERFIEFGILSEDARNGGAFAKEKLAVEDRLGPVASRLTSEMIEVSPRWERPGIPWSERYTEYLQSDEWLDVRLAVLQRDAYRCQWTGKAAKPGDPLQVHHLTYDRVGGELLTDLVTVCRSAHRAHHLRGAA